MESLHNFGHINPWPILVSALIQWFLGAAWYSPVLFVKPWMAALNLTPGKPKKGLVLGMASSLVASLLVSLALHHILNWAHADTLHFALFIGFLCWLAFIAAPNFAQGLYEQRPFILFAINSGYWLTCLLISAPLIALWR